MSREHLRTYERIFWIEAEIRRGAYPNTTTIAEHFGISGKTAQRTLDLMRDRLGRPLEYSAADRGWFYTESVHPLPDIVLTEGELVAILTAERLARQYGGSPVGAQIEHALAKVATALTTTISIEVSALAAAHSFEALPGVDVDPATFKALERATASRRSVEVEYFTASRGVTSTRHLDPLHLRNAQGDWYVIAFDHKRRDVRDFMVHRVRSIRELDRPFQPPVGFDLDAYLAKGFQMIRGTDEIDVVLQFDEHQARWIREGRVPHGSATYEEQPDGELRVTIRVTTLEAVRRYVLQYGSHVRVLAPESLQHEVLLEGERLVRLYRKNRRRPRGSSTKP